MEEAKKEFTPRPERGPRGGGRCLPYITRKYNPPFEIAKKA